MAVVATAEERRDALVGRLFEATLGAFDLMGVYLGDRLGLYRTLSDHGPCTSSELAEAAGIHERYAREWLEQQAVAGVLDVDAAVDPEARGRGLGSLVLLECERLARAAGATSLVLNARDDVQGFYIRHGFVVVGPAETIFSVIKHVRMRKDL